jgi:hypothetical protein
MEKKEEGPVRFRDAGGFGHGEGAGSDGGFGAGPFVRG